MINDIFQKFTNHSKKVLKNAFGLALALGHKNVTPQHILYSLSQQRGSVGAEILAQLKINSLQLKQAIAEETASISKVNQINLNSSSKKLLEKAVLFASLNRHKYIGTEHLLAALLEINDSKINDFLVQNNINIGEIKRQVAVALNGTGKFSDLVNALENFKEREDGWLVRDEINTQQYSVLDLFATNLTDPKIQKKIDPVIGREEEIERIIQILSRRHKNNPILLGDPGVGKTAIIEGLAKKILYGDVPESLLNKKIYTLDLGSVVAGTSFRGEFENRLKQIISEIQKDPNIVLFIDELHNIMGAGSALGSMDAANILKPVLARGNISCIGASTLEDYKKYIETDPALERRFQPIMISQPTTAETIEILQGIKENYEVFHQVKINDEAITWAAELSEKYLPDRFLPDKAIDLIDEAAAAVKIKRGAGQQYLEIKKLEEQLQKIIEKKEEKVKNEEFSLALHYKKQEEEISYRLNKIKEKRATKTPRELPEITKDDISRIIAKMTGIPLQELILEERKRLLNLEKLLAKKIIGQDEALKSVAEFIRRSRTGVGNTNRPIGSFIFLGPSGVGKTELAKVLAESIFGSPDALVRIDMSEFAESFNISKLIGAPAGYVGYREGAKLTDSVKRRPYCVVLFDEIEKAHPQLFNLLLQILEDGHLTDGTGKKINFKNTIVIITSNIGSEEFNKQVALGFQAKTDQERQKAQEGFDEAREQILKKLKQKFLPEFLNRLDKIIVFRPLKLNDIAKIVSLQLEELRQRLAHQDLIIKIDPETIRLIAKKSFSPELGARAVRKTIQELVESQIANKILTRNKNQKKLLVKVGSNKITI